MQPFTPWLPEQARYYVETVQQFESWRAADAEMRRFAGSMSWKEVKGRRYLVRTYDRRGRQASLGPHSPETEMLLSRFLADKQDALARWRNADLRIADLARYNIAARINRLPKMPAWLLTALSRKGILGRTVHVVGTHALYAYEAMAGAVLQTNLLETSDLDFMVDPRRLRLSVEGVPPIRLLDVLREVDASFRRLDKRTYSAENDQGFIVDLIKAAPRNPLRKGPADAPGDLEPVEIPDLKWLVNAPKVQVVVIGADGFPVPMSVPDPRAFALYKFHISVSVNREPPKRGRDMAQAEALVALIEHRLPQYPFHPDHLRMFPAGLRHGIVLPDNPFWNRE